MGWALSSPNVILLIPCINTYHNMKEFWSKRSYWNIYRIVFSFGNSINKWWMINPNENFVGNFFKNFGADGKFVNAVKENSSVDGFFQNYYFFQVKFALYGFFVVFQKYFQWQFFAMEVSQWNFSFSDGVNIATEINVISDQKNHQFHLDFFSMANTRLDFRLRINSLCWVHVSFSELSGVSCRFLNLVKAGEGASG